MTGLTALAAPTPLAASPIWIRVIDSFTGGPPRGPLSVGVERALGATWVPLAVRHQLGPDGDLAFVGLGQARDPQSAGAFTVRITVTSPGTIAEWPGGDAALVTTVTAWARGDAVAPASPTELRLYPGPAYAYPAGTPLIAGRVLDSAGDPVARARVRAVETVQSADRFEDARSDDAGRFRLALRWSEAATTVTAKHGGTSGAIAIDVPDDLSSIHPITLT